METSVPKHVRWEVMLMPIDNYLEKYYTKDKIKWAIPHYEQGVFLAEMRDGYEDKP
jgi:hypothetical protein